MTHVPNPALYCYGNPATHSFTYYLLLLSLYKGKVEYHIACNAKNICIHPFTEKKKIAIS